MTHARNTLTPIADQLDRDLRSTWVQADPKSFADARADAAILRTASLAHDELNAYRDDEINLVAAELGVPLEVSDCDIPTDPVAVQTESDKAVAEDMCNALTIWITILALGAMFGVIGWAVVVSA